MRQFMNSVGVSGTSGRTVAAKRAGACFVGALLAVMAGAAQAHEGDDPLVRPIEPEHSSRWLGPLEPGCLFGNTYSVGFEGLSVALIDTGDGLILVDAAVPQSVPALKDNIRKLGFKLEDIKLILTTEPHYDHSGGAAAMERDTGATVLAGEAAAPLLVAGKIGPDDPQKAWLPPSFPAVKSARGLKDGETIRLGGVTVTALATPGHTAGSMSWTWESCEGERCVNVVFASSLNAVGPDEFRFSAPEQRPLVEAYQRSFERIRTVPCDILITAHPDFRPGDQLIDPEACAAFADASARRLEKRIRREIEGARQ